jgi:hypothetical protein
VAPSESPIEPASSRTGWVRMAVASGATAAGLAALFASVAFALQAVTLPRPSRAQLIAAETLRWLTRQDAVESVALVRGRPVSSFCVNATLGPLAGSPHRLNASLLITGRRRLVETRFASFQLGSKLREEDGPLPAIRAVRAGCPRTLERRIGRFLDKRAPVCVKRVVLRGMPMLRLFFGCPGRGLVLIVEPRTSVPVAIRIAGERTRLAYLSPAERRDLGTPALRLSRRLRLIVREDA